MSEEVKRISAKEFQEFGFLQEVNRQFLHPLGLALEIVIDEEDGTAEFGEVWDARDDPEGFVFGDFDGDTGFRKAMRVQQLWDDKAKVRRKLLGYVIQPIP